MLLVGVCHPWGCNLHYVERKDMDWYFPFTTKTKGDAIHSRIMFVDRNAKIKDTKNSPP
ncbi:hypothetical protein D3C80_781770 [compost metagenome]